MHHRTFLLLALFSWASIATAQDAGRIEGFVHNASRPVGGVTVALVRDSLTLRATMSDSRGRFEFAGVAPGEYTLTFVRLDELPDEQTVSVRAGETIRVDHEVQWESGFSESMTVYAPSRRRERIVDAPTAVTTVGPEDIQLDAPSGQVPMLLEFTPGVRVTQSGLYDYNLNVRGFNTQLNRRIQTLIDGRDPSIPFLSSQEWSQFAVTVDEMSSLELLRGPSAALYGPNSFNGVVNMTTVAPRDSPGAKVDFTFGELDTVNVSGRWAGRIGDGWYMKVLGGHSSSSDFSRSRNETVEYEGLPLEAIPLATTRNNLTTGSVRVDKYLDHDRIMTLEGGMAALAGPVFLTVTGRAQPDGYRGWTRFNFNSPGWNLLFFSNLRDSTDRPSPSTGIPLSLHDENLRLEYQANKSLNDGKLRLVGGANYGYESVDTAGSDGEQSLILEPVAINRGALFGQLDYQATPDLKLVVAARYDVSGLFDPQFSPKAGLVYELAPGHSFRLTYNEAFQVANYAELFINVNTGLPIDLSGVEAGFAPALGGVPLGLGAIPVVVVGNENLEVETIRTVEVGYRGRVGARAFVTADFYRNRMENFITDVLPGVNPSFPPYTAPAELPPPIRATVEQTLTSIVPGLSNDASGAPILAFSTGNADLVKSQGIELGLKIMLDRGLWFDANYSWFDFEVLEQTFDIAPRPNAPTHQFALGVGYRRGAFASAVRYRWVDAFDWASGIFVGPVPSYGVANVSASYDLNNHWALGLNIANVLDEEHYELFGGDLLRRRALGHVAYSWP